MKFKEVVIAGGARWRAAVATCVLCRCRNMSVHRAIVVHQHTRDASSTKTDATFSYDDSHFGATVLPLQSGTGRACSSHMRSMMSVHDSRP